MVSTATAILMVVCIALGSYMFAHFCETTAHRVKREKAEARRTLFMQEVVYETGSQIVKELRDPVTRAAEVKKIAGDLKTALKGMKLAEQFETTDEPTGSVQS